MAANNNIKEFDVVIVGSGFGGSVSALRMAEKGYSVAVLEKGKNWQNKDFPKTNWTLNKYFWMPLLRCFGIQQLHFFKEAWVLSGVGVGGGSLVYANTQYTPPNSFFENEAWKNFADWKTILNPFYNKAKQMLGTTPNPYINAEDLILKEVAKDYGQEHTWGTVNVGVYFGDTQTPTDPYFNGHGPMRTGCTQCAGCMVGCRYGAKNTLDKNYLYFAQKLYGAQIFAETEATVITYSNNEYTIKTKTSTSFWGSRSSTFKAKKIIFSAGVLGTMNLLLKQKLVHKTLPLLSNKLGFNVRTNSETVSCTTAPNAKMNHGIAITSVFNPDENTHVEVVKYSDGSNVLGRLATVAVDAGRGSRVINWLGAIAKSPVKTLKLAFNKNWARNSVTFLVMQNLDNRMRMVVKKFPFTRITMRNDLPERVPAYIPIGQKVLHDYSKKINGAAQNAITEVVFNMSTTGHILGGCPMGLNADTGVVNTSFQVHNYPNMWILDGSIIPCNIGVNPSLTITALSEYAMSLIAPKQNNQNIQLDSLIAQPNTQPQAQTTI